MFLSSTISRDRDPSRLRAVIFVIVIFHQFNTCIIPINLLLKSLFLLVIITLKSVAFLGRSNNARTKSVFLMLCKRSPTYEHLQFQSPKRHPMSIFRPYMKSRRGLGGPYSLKSNRQSAHHLSYRQVLRSQITKCNFKQCNIL